MLLHVVLLLLSRSKKGDREYIIWVRQRRGSWIIMEQFFSVSRGRSATSTFCTYCGGCSVPRHIYTGLGFGQCEGKASWPWLLKIIRGHRGQYAGHQGHWYFKQNIKLMQYTQACIYTYNVCYPIIGVYVYMYTGTLDKINTSAVFEIALVRDKRLFTRTSKQSISSSVRQVKSYNHILFAFEVATVGPTTDDSLNKHCQVHSKVIHNYNCLLRSLDWTSYFVAQHFDVISAEARLCSILDYLLWLLCFWDSSRPISRKSLICYYFIF